MVTPPATPTGSFAHSTKARPRPRSTGSERMACTPYSPMMPSPVSATITSMTRAASSLKIACATPHALPALVATTPASVKSRAISAP